MTCVACGRLLQKAAVSIPSRGGALVMGPKCARRAGLLKARRPAAVRISRPGAADPRQMALELAP